MSADEQTLITAPVREVAGVALPAVGTYVLDSSHSHVGFTVKHLMVAKVRGSLAGVAATIVVAEDILQSSVTVEIDASTITTNDEARDGHLKSADFFNVAEHPTWTFVSSGIRSDGDDWKVDGALTIAGVTRPATLDVEFEGGSVDPWGNAKIGFSAEAQVNREDFGLTWNQALETGGVLIGKNVKVEIDAEAALQP